VFYFFERDQEFVRIEFGGTEDAGYHLTITEPGGSERTERFQSAEAASARWLELQQRYQVEGWWGPSGRD
jgi:hypothetical protein